MHTLVIYKMIMYYEMVVYYKIKFTKCSSIMVWYWLVSFTYPYEEIYHEKYVECQVNLLRGALRPFFA